nr:EF-hand domain-containing protein [Paracoccus saliphilus]
MIITLAAVSAMSQSPVSAQDVTAWDEDQNGTITQAEFMTAFRNRGLSDRWDRNADGSIAAPELAEGFYAFWDRNSDDDLSVDEWENAVDLWLGDVDLAVAEWDIDGDGLISEFEFATAFQRENLVAEFNDGQDDVINAEEIAEVLFAAADSDEDELVAVDAEGFFADGIEPLDDPIDPDMDLIEPGEAFTGLPVPCGTGDDCQNIATDFCSTLGYGAPIDTLAVDGQLYVVRCKDDLLN